MKIVIAPDSFKGSLSAPEVARCLASGVKRVFPEAELVCLPVADGGEGTLDALVAASSGKVKTLTVTGPLGSPVEARYGLLPDGTGVVEMAQASGLTLVPEAQRDPGVTTSRGTGELIGHLLDKGCRKILLGLGGSATNDGGVGVAQALGWSFVDAAGKALAAGGEALARLDWIDGRRRHPRLDSCELVVATDVTNPLLGPQGASAVYGPQKGADAAQVQRLDAALTVLADTIQRNLGLSVHSLPGGGAAGGLGAGLVAFCGAELRSGVDTVLDAVGFDDAVADADLVLTGEGRLDGQSLFGKVPVGVAARSRRPGGAKVPVVAVVGAVGPGAEAVYTRGVSAVVPLADGPLTLEASLRNAASLLENAAERACRLLRVGAELGKL